MTTSRVVLAVVQPATGTILLARGKLTLAMLLVGSSVVSARFIVDSFPILVALGIRQTAAALIMLGIVLAIGDGIPKASRRAHGIVFMQTVTGVVMFNILLMIGVSQTTASASGIITSTVPAMIAIFSRVLGERISRLTMWGIGLAMAGILIVNVAGAGEAGSDAPRPVLGGILVLGAVACEALFTIFGKALTGTMSPVANCYLVCLYGMLLFAPLAIWQLPGFDVGKIPASGWLALAWSTGPVMIGAFFLWFSGLRVIPANAAAVYTGLIPVSAIACSALLLGEAIGWPHVAGMTCVIAAIFLVSRPPRSQTGEP